jgi:hypothetical protein
MEFHEDMKCFGLAQDMVQVWLLECYVGFGFSCTRNKCVVHVKIHYFNIHCVIELVIFLLT